MVYLQGLASPQAESHFEISNVKKLAQDQLPVVTVDLILVFYIYAFAYANHSFHHNLFLKFKSL